LAVALPHLNQSFPRSVDNDMGIADLVARLLGRRKPEPEAERPAPPAARPRPVTPRPVSPQPQVHTVRRPQSAPAQPVQVPSPAPARSAPAPAGTQPQPVSGNAERPVLRPVAPAPLAEPLPTPIPPVPVVQPTAPAEPVMLKPGHRREAIRDQRLAVTLDAAGGRRSRAPRLASAEARRLFAASLRTGNRALRTLATDDAQLERLGLPIWHDEAQLAADLGVGLSTLRHLSIHAARERAPHYVTFAIAKRSGGERLIMAPKARLKAVQRRLNRLLVERLPASDFAHGFRQARSVRSNAAPHVGKRVLVHLDLKDFFPSIHFGRVRGMLIGFGYGYPVASVLATLMTEAPRQPVVVNGTTFFPPVGPRACPQGAPTSPGVSNALVVRMDRRLGGLARRFGFSYTRYADDLTFSGDDIDAAHALRCLAARIAHSEGFAINRAKTRVMRRGARQAVTGVVVNEVLGLSRHDRRRLRAALHRLRQAGGERDAHIEGHLAYLHMLNPQQAAALRQAAYQDSHASAFPLATEGVERAIRAPSPAPSEHVKRDSSSPSPFGGEGRGEG
jgi:hypothetical protein